MKTVIILMHITVRLMIFALNISFGFRESIKAVTIQIPTN